MGETLHFSEAPRFYLFLFVHAAYADYQMHTQEIRFILNKLKELFEDQVDVYEEFLELKDHYETLSTQEIETIIQTNFPQFVGHDIQRMLLGWLSGVIRADGVVKESELEFFAKVKQTMEDPISQ